MLLSKKGNEINPEKALIVRNTIQRKVDSQVPAPSNEKWNEEKLIAKPRNVLRSGAATTPVNVWKYFNRLVFFPKEKVT